MSWGLVNAFAPFTVDATGTSIAVTPTLVTVGNLVVVTAFWTNATSETCAVSDGLANTWTEAASAWDTTGTYGGRIFYSVLTTAGSSTITVNNYGGVSGSRTFRFISVHEYSGNTRVAASVLNQSKWTSNVAGATGTDAITSGLSTATTVDGCLLHGTLMPGRSGSGGTQTAGTGYTVSSAAPGYQNVNEWGVQNAAGAVAATYTHTLANNFWIVGLLAFAPAAPPIPATTPRLIYLRQNR